MGATPVKPQIKSIFADLITDFNTSLKAFISKKVSPFFRNLFLIENFDKNINFIHKIVLSDSVNYTNPKSYDTTPPENIYLTRPNHYLLGLQEKKFECFFVRKNKTFNKGRFSRNRQIYRTGVYFCFYINILTFYGLWYYFYKFKLKFTYIWWLFILLPFSFIHGKALKSNLYFPTEFMYHFKNYINWIFYYK